MRASEIRVKRIRVNQGLGVYFLKINFKMADLKKTEYFKISNYQ